jgi:hypothetical protein
MVDDEGSTSQERLAQIQHVGFRVQASGCSPSPATLSADNLSFGGAHPPAQLKLSPRHYHVFAHAPDRDREAIRQTASDELWTYIAPIHGKRDAIAVSVGLVESGLAVEAHVAVIAQSPGPRAGEVIVIHSAPATQTETCATLICQRPPP